MYKKRTKAKRIERKREEGGRVTIRNKPTSQTKSWAQSRQCSQAALFCPPDHGTSADPHR